MLIYNHYDLKDFFSTGGNAPLYVDVRQIDREDGTIGYHATLTKLIIIAFRNTVADVALSICKMEVPNQSEVEKILKEKESKDVKTFGSPPTFEDIAEIVKPLIEEAHKGIVCAPGASFELIEKLEPKSHFPPTIDEWKQIVEEVENEHEEEKKKREEEAQKQELEMRAHDFDMMILRIKQQMEQEKRSQPGGLVDQDNLPLVSDVSREDIKARLEQKRDEIRDKMKKPPTE